jgi:hypothetical protein
LHWSGIWAGSIDIRCRRIFQGGRARSLRASVEENTRALSGDELIPDPLASLTHAITLRCARANVWPWLVQMGAGSRAGWYSYEFLDNGRTPSAVSIVPFNTSRSA